MCGILGVVDFSNDRQTKNWDVEEFRKVAYAQSHRGPDYTGVSISDNGILGHNRLSIIDLDERSHQPFENERYSLVFNGEIYNYKSLRNSLVHEGFQFNTSSDTEVLFKLLISKGESAISQLRGMFAFVFWDRQQRKVIAARDRIGQKPLYYTLINGCLYFASELNTLVELLPNRVSINKNSIRTFLQLQYIPSPDTIYDNVYKMNPAEYKVWGETGTMISEKYWRPSDYCSEVHLSKGLTSIRNKLIEAIELRLMADVPVGALLSGGLDSNAIVSIAAKELGVKLESYTVSFADGDKGGFNDDLVVATKAAKDYKVPHHVVHAFPNIEEFDQIIMNYGEPFGDYSAIPTYYINKAISQDLRVALTGDGADEIFGGYNAYYTFENFRSKFSSLRAYKLPTFLHDAVKRFELYNQKDFIQAFREFRSIFKSHQISGKIPYSGLYDNVIREQGRSFLLMYDQYYTQPDHLNVKMDIASMANSVEARSPFNDHELVELVNSIQIGSKLTAPPKGILRNILEDYVIDDVIRKPKTGFTPPLGSWLRNEMREEVIRRIFNQDVLKEYGIINAELIKRIITEHFSNKRNHHHKIWLLYVLSTWLSKNH